MNVPKKTLVLGCALIVSAWGCSDNNAVAQDAADYVLTNGKIYTVNDEQPWAEAVAIKGTDIVYVGDDKGAAAHAGEGTEVVDLQGRLVLPGFVESHFHIVLGAASTSGIHLGMTDTIEDVQRKVKQYADAHPEKKTIFGASYDADLFDERGPNKDLLDNVVPDRPVYLLDHTLHSAWVNSKALEVAGITKDTEDPRGGQFVRDGNGEPTGAVKGGSAHFPIMEATEAVTAEAIKVTLPEILEGLSELGFTSVMDLGAPIATEEGFSALIALDRAGELPLRVSLTHIVNTASLAATAVEDLGDYAKRFRSDHVWMDTLKIISDSVLENQKAAMLEPYLSTGDRAALVFDKEEQLEMVLGATDKGYNVVVHALGDWAVRESLDSFEAARNAGRVDSIFTVTHAQVVDPADRPRFGKLNVIMQGTGNWAGYYPGLIAHIGNERYETLVYPFRDLVDSGAIVALGSDWPATAGGFESGVNAFVNMQTAMNRAVPKPHLEPLGAVDGKLPPLDQVLTLQEAVRAYTINGARQLGIADKTGSIEVGKKADMILLHQNIFEINPQDIYKTKVLTSMMDGKIWHDVVYGLGDDDLVDLDNIDKGVMGPCDEATDPYVPCRHGHAQVE